MRKGKQSRVGRVGRPCRGLEGKKLRVELARLDKGEESKSQEGSHTSTSTGPSAGQSARQPLATRHMRRVGMETQFARL